MLLLLRLWTEVMEGNGTEHCFWGISINLKFHSKKMPECTGLTFAAPHYVQETVRYAASVGVCPVRSSKWK